MFKIRSWMRAYKSPTAKRTMVLANTSHIAMLETGKMTRAQLTSTTKTSIKLPKKNGKARYQGSPALKGTQWLVTNLRGLFSTIDVGREER